LPFWIPLLIKHQKQHNRIFDFSYVIGPFDCWYASKTCWPLNFFSSIKFILISLFKIVMGLGQPSLVWVWKISLKKFQIFQFFPLRIKKISSGQVKMVPGSNTRQPLIYCKSKVCSGWVGSRPISTLKYQQGKPNNSDSFILVQKVIHWDISLILFHPFMWRSQTSYQLFFKAYLFVLLFTQLFPYLADLGWPC